MRISTHLSAAAVVAMAAGHASGQFFEGFEHGDWLDNYTWLNRSTTPNVVDGTSARTGDFGVTFVGAGFWQNSRTEAVIEDGAVFEYYARGSGGRVYVGFTSDELATEAYTVVAAPNTDNLIIQRNSGFTFLDLAASAPITWSETEFFQVVASYEDGIITAEAFDASGASLAPPIMADTGFADGGRLLLRGFSSTQADDIDIAGGTVCFADCDGSGELDFFDFLCFQDQFAAGDPEADCDGSGELDFFDFLCFQNEFAAGCE